MRKVVSIILVLLMLVNTALAYTSTVIVKGIGISVTSDEGRNSLAKEMGFTTPFDTFTEEYVADNPLLDAANAYIDAGKTSVAWCFTTMPSENWKNGVGSALLEYAQGTGEWDGVVSAFVDGWATEYAATAAE